MDHMLDDGISMGGRNQVVFGQEELGHGIQSLPRPREHPVNVGTANETREVAAPISQRIASRRHAKDHVQIFRTGAQEVSPNCISGGEKTLRVSHL